jgi:hypothetical protein
LKSSTASEACSSADSGAASISTGAECRSDADKDSLVFDFFGAIEGGHEPMVSARKNMATVRTFLAEHESARRGGEWVDVSPDT